MTYGFLIAINLAAYITSSPIAPLNLIIAGFVAGLWAAEIMNRRVARGVR